MLREVMRTGERSSYMQQYNCYAALLVEAIKVLLNIYCSNAAIIFFALGQRHTETMKADC